MLYVLLKEAKHKTPSSLDGLPGADPPEGRECRGPELGVRLRSLKHSLSQTPLSQGQAPGSLGPFQPPRTLELLGIPLLGDLDQARLPVAAASPAAARIPRLGSSGVGSLPPQPA